MENSSIKIVFWIACILIMFQACTSDHDTYISFTEDEVFKLKEGDILVYKNDENEFDSVYIHSVKLKYIIIDQTQMGSQTYYQWQIVKLSGDKMPKNNYEQDRLYCGFSFQAEHIGYLNLEDTMFILNSVLSDSIVNIQGVEYENVHTFEFDENLNDSLSARKYVFCPKYGIIQYELLDGTVYSFSHFIHSKESL